MKIAVYSGTFNPLHIGHLAIMEYLTSRMDFDEVYLVVSPRSPFKGAELAGSGRMRYDAAVEAVRRHPELKVRVEDLELYMPAPQYTIRTLDALAEREPENIFSLVMGADNLASVLRWKEADRILAEYGVVVYPRKGYDMKALKSEIEKENPLYRISLMADAPVVEISSTEIREGISSGRDMARFLM